MPENVVMVPTLKSLQESQFAKYLYPSPFIFPPMHIPHSDKVFKLMKLVSLQKKGEKEPYLDRFWNSVACLLLGQNPLQMLGAGHDAADHSCYTSLFCRPLCMTVQVSQRPVFNTVHLLVHCI